MENDDPAYDKMMGCRNTKGRAMIAKSYAKGGEVDGKVKKGVHQHESALHKGEKKTHLKLKSGGHVEGHHGKHKLDKYAGGGKVKGKKGVTVNVMVAPSQQQPPQKIPVPVPAGGGMPPHPPMGGPPPGAGMPPQGLGARPPMARGGKVHYKPPYLPGGAGGGLARLAKAKAY